MTRPNPQVVFEHALNFLVADGILRTKAKDDERAAFYIQHPGMICSAFCSELLLKCLLLLEGKTPPNKHDLKVLYDLLEPARRKRIEELWDADVKEREDGIRNAERKLNATIPRDLPTALRDCRNAFVLMRYVYEDPKKATFYITFFPHILCKVVEEKTGWRLG